MAMCTCSVVLFVVAGRACHEWGLIGGRDPLGIDAVTVVVVFLSLWFAPTMAAWAIWLTIIGRPATDSEHP